MGELQYDALRESGGSRGSDAALALGGSLDPRAAERRAHYHGRELERVAGRRVDDRIVSVGPLSRVPSVGRNVRVLDPSLDTPLHLHSPPPAGPRFSSTPLRAVEQASLILPDPLTPLRISLVPPPPRFLPGNMKFLLKCAP